MNTETRKLASESLCIYDKRSPYLEDTFTGCDEDTPQPRQKDCSCDNCFYGRDRLAAVLLDTLGLDGIKQLTSEEKQKMNIKTIYRAELNYDATSRDVDLYAVGNGLVCAMQNNAAESLDVDSFGGSGACSPYLVIESSEREEVERALRRALDYLKPLGGVKAW